LHGRQGDATTLQKDWRLTMKMLFLAAATALTIGIGSAYAGEGEGGANVDQQRYATYGRPAVQGGHTVASVRNCRDPE
jgi:hypothetical protein